MEGRQDARRPAFRGRCGPRHRPQPDQRASQGRLEQHLQLNLRTQSSRRPRATPTFDADGNLLSDGTRSYERDLQNRLVKITWGAGSNKSTEFRYNALGQRSQRVEKTGTTDNAHRYYLYDGIRYLCRYTAGTAAPNIDRRYFNEGEQRKNGASWNSHHYTRSQGR